MFDKLICLGEGKVVYGGPVSELPAYMDSVGDPVPPQHNPADHILFSVQTRTAQDLNSLCEKWNVQAQSSVEPEIRKIRGDEMHMLTPPQTKRKSFWTQLSYLVVREFRETTRNKIALVMRFVVAGFMNILFALIFQGIGNKNNLQSHFGALCNVLIGTMFGSMQPILLGFPLERPVFLRDYAANMYGCVPYFLAKSMIELPMTFLTSLETFLISYWTMGLQGNFIELVLVAWALSLTAASTALFIGCSVSSVQTAQELAPLMFVPQILFAGVFVQIDLIPSWMRWLQYTCALKYAINLASIAELRDLPGVDGPHGFLAAMDIHIDRAWLYIVVLVFIFSGFRLLAMANLRRRAKFVF